MLGWIHLGLTSTLTYNLYRNLKKRMILRDSSDLKGGVLEGLTLAIPVRNEAHNLKELIPQKK